MRRRPASWVGSPTVWLPVSVVLLVALLVVVITVTLQRDDRTAHRTLRPPPGPRPAQRAARAFTPNSWWNTPLSVHAPLDPAGGKILTYLRTAPQSGDGCLNLAGAGSSPWGTPIYWARPSDPVYDVQGVSFDRPPELNRLRIPVGARPAADSDQTMVIYDRQRGYVVALTGAQYQSDTRTWTARGATLTYLASNGLNVETGRSDNPHNVGTHRGNNGPTMVVSYDQVAAGEIRHVLKVASGPELSSRFVFPMVGSDGGYTGTNPAVPPEGLRLRIKPQIDLAGLQLNPQALVIATAIQRYGIYLGDSSGATALKLENTSLEGRGRKWTLSAHSLCKLPFTSRYWEVLRPGYDPTG